MYKRSFFSKIVDKASIIGAVITLAILLAWAWGYGSNIRALFNIASAGDHVGEIIIRTVSIFPLWPLGGIVGWF